MAFDLFAQQLLVRSTRLEDYVPACDKCLDGGKPQRFKLAPQTFHPHDPTSNIDRAKEGKIPRHDESSA